MPLSPKRLSPNWFFAQQSAPRKDGVGCVDGDFSQTDITVIYTRHTSRIIFIRRYKSTASIKILQYYITNNNTVNGIRQQPAFMQI